MEEAVVSWIIDHIDWTIVISIIVALSIYYEIMPACTFGVCKLVQFLKRKVWR